MSASERDETADLRAGQLAPSNGAGESAGESVAALQAALAAQRRRLRALQAVAEATATLAEPAEVAHVAVGALGEALGAAQVAFFVADPTRGLLVPFAQPDDLSPDVRELLAIPLDDDHSVGVQTFRDGQARSLLLHDAEPPTPWRLRVAWARGIRSLALAPLQAAAEALGVAIAVRVTAAPFDADDLALLTAGCRQVAGALARARAHAAEREARLRLAVEAERLQAIMENTDAHLAYLDRDFRFVKANSTYVRGCGHAEAELIGRSHFELFPNAENQAIFEQVRDTGRPYQVRARPFKYVDQPWRGVTYWDWTLTPVGGEHGGGGPGEVAGLVLSIVDVTEAVRLRQEAERRTAELEAILASIADGVVIWGPSGQLLEMNPAAETILGRSLAVEQQEPSAARRAVSYAPLDARGEPFPLEQTPALRALRGETVVNLEMRLRRPDDSWVDVLCSAAPIRRAAGAQSGAVIVFQDITGLRALDRAKDEFIATASHELKSPLTSAKGFCQVLLRHAERSTGCERCTRNLRAIDNQINRVVRLIDQLLDISRLQVGRLDLRCEPTDLVEVAYQAAANAQATAPAHEIRVTPPAAEVVGDWDRTRLEQVLGNLLANAVKYSPQGGPVEVALSREDRWAVVRVVDHGVGIAAADQERLFTRYYRAGGARTAAVDGLGLGLFICDGIVRQHGGEMFVASELGRGSTFGFRLPLPQSANQSI